MHGLLPAFGRADGFAPPRDAAGGRTADVFDLRVGRSTLEIGGRPAHAVTVNGSIPAPLLRLREGSTATIRVTNLLDEDTSIHWHGIILPNDMDGVPLVTFPGIAPRSSFTYTFPVAQSGTYWYHSHSGMQEQLGVYGPMIIDPAEPDATSYDREHVVLLSDWTFEDPHRMRPGDAGLADRAMWGRMRMDPTDIADVTGTTYTYLMNGRPPASPWTGLFQPGERVRLRLINAGAATYFDVRIPGLRMTVVQADGQDVVPTEVDELRIAIAETYDVVVHPEDAPAYTVFAETMDRSGYAAGTLATEVGRHAPIPERRKRPLRSMADMGMAGHSGGHAMPPAAAMDMAHAGHDMPGNVTSVAHGPDRHGVANSTVPDATGPRLDDPGVGLGDDGRRVLLYSDLRSLTPTDRGEPVDREIELHLTGNMERYLWSFDGKKFSQASDPIPIRLAERVRITFVNDTMMEHPIHLHGMWMVLENGAGDYRPRKHTVNVKPAERLSVVVTPDVPGKWALHCHILYHMEAGMFRVVEVAGTGT
jgi:FtsP/CotA-like multicopper oxidase with cupredoxin domain